MESAEIMDKDCLVSDLKPFERTTRYGGGGGSAFSCGVLQQECCAICKALRHFNKMHELVKPFETLTEKMCQQYQDNTLSMKDASIIVRSLVLRGLITLEHDVSDQENSNEHVTQQHEGDHIEHRTTLHKGNDGEISNVVSTAPTEYDLTERVIKDMTSSRSTKSTDMQTEDMRRSINGFYDTLEEHPAILSDRVVFSSKKSDFEPENLKSGVFDEDQRDIIDSSEEFSMSKRFSPYTEVCNSRQFLTELRYGYNVENRSVRLKPGQKFHVTKCERGGRRSVSCSGIDSTFPSQCMEKQSWVTALVWSDSKQDYVPDSIRIDTCCTCRIDTRNAQ
ncbi:uncharacterized protein [Ptychodera flava]|uniref:uncharacterized protein isoform X2 n=1 Tax=Ptychodera flava TaxID=63121 RepID=UPI00396A3C63